MSVARSIIDGPIIDLEQRRYGLYRWTTARGRPTRWHLIDTDAQMGETVTAYDANAGLPSFRAIPMLCGVRCPSLGAGRHTRIRTWEELCGMTVMRWDSVLKTHVQEADEVCGACILLAVKALSGGLG